MITSDIYTLLERFFSDGFTKESLSKATNAPVELINRCSNKNELSQNDFNELNQILYFLTQLYLCDTSDNTYLKNIVTSMSNYFMISTSAIAHYLNLDEEALSDFLLKPESYTDGYHLSIKLLHLFTTLVFDKRYSVYEN